MHVKRHKDGDSYDRASWEGESFLLLRLCLNITYILLLFIPLSFLLTTSALSNLILKFLPYAQTL